MKRIRFTIAASTLSAVLVLTVVAATSTGAAFRQVPTPSTDLIVSIAWLAERLADPGVVVIATGSRASYEAAHIPGARFVEHDATLGSDHRMIQGAALARALAAVGATDESRIVLYGDEPMATGWLYMAFASIGHGDHVSLLSGNISAWKADGQSVTSEVPPAGRGTLTAREAPDVIVDAPWVRERLEVPAVQVLDVRTEREWDRGRAPRRAARALAGPVRRRRDRAFQVARPGSCSPRDTPARIPATRS